jgi:hypothetical protein
MSRRDEEVLFAVAGRRPNSRGQVRANCPFCLDRKGKADRRQSLGLNVHRGKWSCFRCDAYGWLRDAEERWASVERQDEPPAPSLPDEFVPLWRDPGATALSLDAARAYLRKRGVGASIIEAARIGACSRGRLAERIVVPIDRADGSLAGWVARTWHSDAERKYLYPSGMNRTGLVYNAAALDEETDIPVLVVEGVFDTFPFWPDAVAVLGSPTDSQVDVLASARRPVVVVLDGDAWEKGMWLAMRLRFDGAQAGHVRLPPGKDPDEVDLDWLRAAARDGLAA